MANNNELQNAAYVSFTSLESLVKRLKETAIPPVIDGSILVNMSGSAASQMKTALRFLGLTEVKDSKDLVTKQLRALVAAQGSVGEWKEQWQQIVEDVYDPITKDIDINKATVQQLRDAIRAGSGATGTIDRAVRFYVSALDAAGIKYSPHFKSKSRGSVSGTKPPSGTATKRKRAKKKPNGDGESDSLSLREDWQRFDLPLKSAAGKVRIDLPEAMTRREWNYLRTTIEGYFGLVWGEEEETQ